MDDSAKLWTAVGVGALLVAGGAAWFTGRESTITAPVALEAPRGGFEQSQTGGPGGPYSQPPGGPGGTPGGVPPGVPDMGAPGGQGPGSHIPVPGPPGGQGPGSHLSGMPGPAAGGQLYYAPGGPPSGIR